MAEQQGGTMGQRRLPPHPVCRPRSYMPRSWPHHFGRSEQFLVAGVYPDGYSS
jgi:hypothetical protein